MSEPAPPSDTQGGDELLAQLADEFLRRHRAAEHPSVDEYATRHPELGDRIRDLFPAMIAMERPGIGATFDAAPSTERVGTTIGRYKLLERIGEGGFGVVYMAEQQHPVRRKVALKVIKPGVDTRQVIARFEAERQALALMEHENIAKVLDAGATDSGRPYFVMELVHGVPITEFCDRNELPPHERLELFVHVCRAVQHAHTKGIIHRDIKPTNVLVTLHEGVAVPKVIDFGVAKATGQQLTEKTLFTNFAQMVGTPLYMSPEQAEMTSVDVDTRSDVYSLGVLLYELLTGTTPLDKDRLKQAAFDEVRRIIREEEPPKPSTRLVESKASLASISAQRHTDPAKLTRLLRGELDWIVMKALEKERARRYETAHGLAQDVQRYLAREPVLAGPPTARYRFGKFARRHWKPLAATLAFALLLVSAVVTLSVALVAVNQERQQKEAALEREGRRRKQARSALDAMSSTLIEDWLAKQATLSPEHKQFLESALRSYEEFAADTGQEEESRAGVANAYRRVGTIRDRLGQQGEAEAALQRSRQLYARLVAEFPANDSHRLGLARALMQLGVFYSVAGRGSEAESTYDEALTQYRKLVADFPNVAEYRHNLGGTLNNMGRLLRKLGREAEAEAAYRQAIAVFNQLVREFPAEPQHRAELARTYINLALLVHPNPGRTLDPAQPVPGRLAEAVDSMTRGVEIFERLAAEFPATPVYMDTLSTSLDQLAGVLRDAGRNPEAEEIFQQALATRTQLVADYPAVPEHRRGLAMTLNNLGILLKNTGRAREAEELYKQSLAIHKQLAAELPSVPDHQNEVAGAMVNLARMQLDRNELVGARRLLEDAVPYHQTALKAMPNHPAYRRFYRINRWRLAETFLKLNDHAAAADAAGQFLAAAVELPRDAYTAAGLFAGCVTLAAQDKSLTELRRQELTTAYGDRAIAALRQAIDAGYSDRTALATDSSLEAMRSRDDFQTLLTQPGPATRP